MPINNQHLHALLEGTIPFFLQARSSVMKCLLFILCLVSHLVVVARAEVVVPAPTAESEGKRASVEDRIWSEIEAALTQAHGAFQPPTQKEKDQLQKQRKRIHKLPPKGAAQVMIDAKAQTMTCEPMVIFASPSVLLESRYVMLPQTGAGGVGLVNLAKEFHKDKSSAAFFDQLAAEVRGVLEQERRLKCEIEALSSADGREDSAEAVRALSQQEVQSREVQILKKQVELGGLFQALQQSLQEQVLKHRGLVLPRIKQQLTAAGTARGIDLIIDESGRTLLGVSPVVYANPALHVGSTEALGRTLPTLKMGLVDLGLLLDNHWKTKKMNAEITAAEGKAQARLVQLNREGSRLVEEYQLLKDQYQRASASSADRDIVRRKAQMKLEAIDRKSEEVANYTKDVQAVLKRTISEFRSSLWGEIAAMVSAEAEKRGLNLILDTSGPGLEGLPIVEVRSNANDLTAVIQQAINAGH